MGTSVPQLRVVEAHNLNWYLGQRNATVSDSPSLRFQSEFVVYHSWLPGFLEVNVAQARAAEALRTGLATVEMASDIKSLLAVVTELGWTQPDEPSIDALVARTSSDFVALQNPNELRRFLEIVKRRRPAVVVEIGTAAGGMLYCLSQLAAADALLVSIDYQDGPFGGGQTDAEIPVFRSFLGPQQHLHCIRDRSFHYSSLCDLRTILGGRSIDLLFIDGDHSYGAVRSDYSMYGPLVGPGGMVAFHDIVMEPEVWGRGNDAGVAWAELCSRVEGTEIIDPDGLRTPPPDSPEKTYEEMARRAWGIGLLQH